MSSKLNLLPRAFAIVLAAAVVAVVVSCGGGGNKTPSTSSQGSNGQPTPRPTVSSSPAAGGVLTNLSAAGQALSQSDYTLTTVISTTAAGTTQRIQSTIQVKPTANAFKATITGAPGVPSQEIIGINNVIYVNAGGNWLQVPGNTIPYSPDLFLRTINTFWTSQANRNGTKTVGGVSCDNYDVTTAAGQKATVCISQNRPVEITYSDATTSTIATIVYGNVPAITAPR